MFFLFIFALILFVIAIISVIAYFVEREASALGFAAGCIVVGGILTFISCFAIVGTKEVGIVTSFNRPIGELDNGFHLIPPWQGVTEMDAAIQTDTHQQAQSSTTFDCVQARIAHQIVACVDTTIRWRIREKAADSLFQNYRDFANVRTSLVTRELATDINNELASYDPLAVDSQGNSAAPTLASEATTVLGDMRSQIGDQIDILSIYIPVMHFDGATQGRLNALQAQIALTRIAQQKEQTNAAEALANQALAASVSTDPNVLVSKCFTIMDEMVAKGQAIPPGFSCWPGGGTGVVLPAVK